MAEGPRLLITGFGPFPGAPENPTERLVKALAAEPAEAFGADAFPFCGAADRVPMVVGGA